MVTERGGLVGGRQLPSHVEELLAVKVEQSTLPDHAGPGDRSVRYPEWDQDIDDYRLNWCRVVERTAEEGSGDIVGATLSVHGSAVSALRRFFEGLRPPGLRRVPRQADGDERRAVPDVVHRHAAPDFVYRRTGDLFAPTEWAGSPWSRELQHAGPVCGLVGEAAEAMAREAGLRVARLTVDLCRPTPLSPLRRSVDVVRRGRRLTLLEVRLWDGDEAVTRGTALRLAARAICRAGGAAPSRRRPGRRASTRSRSCRATSRTCRPGSTRASRCG